MLIIDFRCSIGKTKAKCRKPANDVPAARPSFPGFPVPGFPEYVTVTREGAVYSRGRLLKGSIHYKGYRKVCLSLDGKNKGFFVHSMIAAAFIGPRPPGFHVDHIDGVKLDNSAGNLRYLSAKENEAAKRMRYGGHRGANGGKYKAGRA